MFYVCFPLLFLSVSLLSFCVVYLWKSLHCLGSGDVVDCLCFDVELAKKTAVLNACFPLCVY